LNSFVCFYAGYLIIDIIVCTEQRENVQINDKQSGEKVGGLRVWKSGRTDLIVQSVIAACILFFK
jgi:glycerol kinase